MAMGNWEPLTSTGSRKLTELLVLGKKYLHLQRHVKVKFGMEEMGIISCTNRLVEDWLICRSIQL